MREARGAGKFFCVLDFVQRWRTAVQQWQLIAHTGDVQTVEVWKSMSIIEKLTKFAAGVIGHTRILDFQVVELLVVRSLFTDDMKMIIQSRLELMA